MKTFDQTEAIQIPGNWVVEISGSDSDSPMLHLSDMGQSFVLPIDKQQLHLMLQSIEGNESTRI